MVFLSICLVVLAFLAGTGAIREAKDEEFPFQVSVQSLQKRHLCGGAIITPKWVLTASDCVRSNMRTVRVCYGSADSNSPLSCIESQRLEFQNELNYQRKNRFLLIELQKPIEFSKTVKAAGVPTSKAALFNTTKLSGWKIERGIDVPPSLYVSDVYFVIPKDCRSPLGSPVDLGFDEFCGVDDENRNELFDLGTTASKRAVVVGMLTQQVLSPSLPNIYTKLFDHELWIKKTLGADAQHVEWVDEIPKDSAMSQCAISFVLLGISTMFLQFISNKN